MAIKLTQGADSTIVTAATRAGLATSPKDYSSIFDSVSESYAKSTEASAEAWGQIAGTIAVVGAELQKNAEVYSDTAQRIYNAGGTEELVDSIYDIKDELSALGTFGGKFGDRETRRKRSEILARRNKLFAQIDGWGESLEEASLASKNGLLDYSLMGGDVEFVNAIIASNTPNKITGEGNNEARVSRDPQTGELIYTLHDMNSGGAAIPGKTMSLSTFKTIIQDSAKDVDNVTGKFLSGVTDGAENMGATYGGTMDEYHKSKLLDSLDSMTSNAATLKRGMRTKFSGTSFFNELTGPNQTELSSKYFTLMLQDIANVKNGEIKADALGDVKDTDGSGGISQQEINDQYVLFQNSILTGEGPMAKKLFTDFVMNKAETAYNFGAKQKAKGTPSETSDFNLFGGGAGTTIPGSGVDGGKDKYISGAERDIRRNSVMNIVNNESGAGTRFSGELNDYEWDKKGGFWTVGDKKYTTLDLMVNERIHFPGGKFEGGLGTSTLVEEEVTQETAFNVVGVDKETKLRNNIFDKNEDDAAIDLRNILGGKYQVDERVYGRDVLRIRTKAGDDIQIVQVEKDENGKYVPQINASGDYVYKNRIQTDFLESSLDRKTQEMMAFYYTFADPNSKHYDKDVFSEIKLPTGNQ